MSKFTPGYLGSTCERVTMKGLSTLEVSSYLKFCPVTRHIFKGVYAADYIPNLRPYNEAAIVVNTDISTGKGVHWLALYYKNGKLEFFDSFGRGPEYFQPHISKYVRNYPHVEYERTRLQIRDDLMCGYYSIFYILKRSFGISSMDIFNHLQNIENSSERDHFVSEFLTNNILSFKPPGNNG
ncbi:uncharacterized protein NPIL_3781 [Nephila pilipes]|uniref:Uncharacterized protein n=1 Tax=Nephila pilipes TaxID=299642 RepID=A0A8X6MQS6_NEPPI|nr:uncharacterized protein NPIL_3781 [Nephila pilipes]